MRSLSVISKQITGILILYGLYLLILLTLPYFSFERDTDFLLTKRAIIHLDYFRYAFYAHIFSSPLLILSGLIQFSPIVLKKYTSIHRMAGKVYLIILLFISAPGAMVLSFYANGYLLTKISFILLTSLWIYFAIMGFLKIRKGEVESHSNFMLRCYALTLSAITLRFYAYLLGYFNADLHPKDAYMLISLLSWIPNLLLAEILIRKGFIRSILRKSGRTTI